MLLAVIAYCRIAYSLADLSRILAIDEKVITEFLNKLVFITIESQTKEVDLALLSLIYPYNLLDDKMKKEVLKRVETNLVRNRGLIRYDGDKYYHEKGEAEWTMGFPWLAIIYKQMGNKEKYAHYMKKTFECLNDKGELPELYNANSDKHNENSPLGWAQSLYLVAAN